jgi:flagellin FlaB
MNRTEKSQGTNEDASIGIGAMIVFIALILVAAVASAVIIQTAEKLQQTAQQTGADTEAEQGSKIVLLSAIISASATDVITLTFELGAGSETIPEASVAWMVVADGGATLVMDSATFAAATDLGGGGTPSSFVPGTAYELPISLADCGLAVSTEYQLTIAVNGGGITYETLSTGLSIADGELVI